MREGESRPPHSRQLLRICGLPAVTALFERDPRRVVGTHCVGKRERSEIELARSTTRRLEVVPERARQAVGKVRVAVDRLHRAARPCAAIE